MSPPKVLLLFEKWNLVKAPQMVPAATFTFQSVLEALDCVSFQKQSSTFAADDIY